MWALCEEELRSQITRSTSNRVVGVELHLPEGIATLIGFHVRRCRAKIEGRNPGGKGATNLS